MSIRDRISRLEKHKPRESMLIRVVWSDDELVDEDADDTSEDDIIITWEGNAGKEGMAVRKQWSLEVFPGYCISYGSLGYAGRK